MAVISGPVFLEMSRSPSLRLSHLVFALLKADEPFWSKSYVFQNKAKIGVNGGALTTSMCRQRTM